MYLNYLEHKDAELRFDALVCLGPVTEVREHVEVYRKCLRDKDPRIRELALSRLAEEAGERALESLRADVEVFLDDPDMKIKRAALKILQKAKE